MALGLGKGTAIATLSIWVGALLSTIVSFFTARYLFRDHVRAFIMKNPKLRAIDYAIQTKGQRIVLLMRFSPIVPFGIFNYVIVCIH